MASTISSLMPQKYRDLDIPPYLIYHTPEPIDTIYSIYSDKPVSQMEFKTETVYIPIFTKAYYFIDANRYRFYYRTFDGKVGDVEVDAEAIDHYGKWHESVIAHNFPMVKQCSGKVFESLTEVLDDLVANAKTTHSYGSINWTGDESKIKFLYEEEAPGFFPDFNLGSVKVTVNKPKNSMSQFTLQKLAAGMPGAREIVAYPCDHPGTMYSTVDLNGMKVLREFPEKSPLMNVIMHLNDNHAKWTREKIADWIDELHDKGIINAEFEAWDDKPEENSLKETNVDASKIVWGTLDGWNDVGYTTMKGLADSFENLSVSTKLTGEAFEKFVETLNGSDDPISDETGDSNNDYEDQN